MTRFQISSPLPLCLLDATTIVDIKDDSFYTYSSTPYYPKITIDSISALLRRIHGSSQLKLAGQLYSSVKGSGLIFDKDIRDFHIGHELTRAVLSV